MTRQWHFDFCDWEAAFAFFYRHRIGEAFLPDEEAEDFPFVWIPGDRDLVLVVSTAAYVSGYWIEPAEGVRPDGYTRIFRTTEEVYALEQRIRAGRNKNYLGVIA